MISSFKRGALKRLNQLDYSRTLSNLKLLKHVNQMIRGYRVTSLEELNKNVFLNDDHFRPLMQRRLILEIRLSKQDLVKMSFNKVIQVSEFDEFEDKNRKKIRKIAINTKAKFMLTSPNSAMNWFFMLPKS